MVFGFFDQDLCYNSQQRLTNELNSIILDIQRLIILGIYLLLEVVQAKIGTTI